MQLSLLSSIWPLICFPKVKYIALLALVKIVPSHPHLVAEYQDTILASVNDQDISIRMRALDLVSAMVC
jgi:AP-3 complex subunit delta-1